jgi:hypothetical protein
MAMLLDGTEGNTVAEAPGTAVDIVPIPTNEAPPARNALLDRVPLIERLLLSLGETEAYS